MIDVTKPFYDQPRNWIKVSRERGASWDEIMLANMPDNDSLQRFLDFQHQLNYWPTLSVKEWITIVKQQKTAEENVKSIDLKKGTAIIVDPKAENTTSIPTDPYSSWQLYRKRLLVNGFKKESVEEIERATLRILRHLSGDTTESGPVKGLVIGNVQSGKTANMAALMAMAADWGWNLFIILSGTIENLRIQTQTRLFNDLNHTGNIFWRSLEHLSKTVDMSQKAQSLHFDDGSKERYFTVCLKNSTRLSKMIQWAQADPNKQRQMRILVIDDEADQAGINTGNIDAEERKRINKLICALVNGQNEKAVDIETKYHAMNYIGYTATPYANILNEAAEYSLYPRNFICTLAVSKEYFGPQQIFGYSSDDPDTNFDGLDIVRIISKSELNLIKNIHDGASDCAPESLKDAICWFLCGVSCMRIWGYKKPISMLVHTSQKTAHHGFLASVISDWLENNTAEEIINRAHSVWLKETTCFTIEKFREQYPSYDRPDESINTYPPFSDIAQQILIILNDGISHIQLGDDGDLTYHKGVHLCIDNCTNSGITSDGMHVRLAYPEPSKMPTPAPAFIVVGGATLSRGLTLEGLISTFFLRSVGQADTLMQMGRWFGYRKNYELLPRLWITEKTKEQFVFLSQLDQELRDEIQKMDINGMSPAEYGPKVKNSPKVSLIKITSKNKMQSATESDFDYSGASIQTYLFDNDPVVLDANISATEKFLAGLGEAWQAADPYGLRVSSVVWKNISFRSIRTFIESFKFQERMRVFNDTKPLLDWVEKVTAEGKLGMWNVVVCGKNESDNGVWTLPNGKTVNKVLRTRKEHKKGFESIINLGALRKPSDLLSDIDVDAIKNPTARAEVVDYIKRRLTKNAAAFRDRSGLETTPQMLIYRVDKDSRATGKPENRYDLGAKRDLIGICLYIPGGKPGTNYASSVSIKMRNDVFDGNADVEGADEN